MEKELLYTPVLVAPTQEELRSLLATALTWACKALRDFVHANYHTQERWRYSDKRDAFDCLCFEGDKRLCSLHMRQNRLSLLVMLSPEERKLFEAHMDEFSPAVQGFYHGAYLEKGVKWVRIVFEDTALLEDSFPLIRFKANLTGMEKIDGKTKHFGDDEK